MVNTNNAAKRTDKYSNMNFRNAIYRGSTVRREYRLDYLTKTVDKKIEHDIIKLQTAT